MYLIASLGWLIPPRRTQEERAKVKGTQRSNHLIGCKPTSVFQIAIKFKEVS
jgi:hypothetical protein